MPIAFSQANARNKAEIKRLDQLIANLKFINKYHNASNSLNWLWNWENNSGNGLSENNIARIENANRSRKSNPTNYNIKKLTNTKINVDRERSARLWMYGYLPKIGPSWIVKRNGWAMPNIPVNELDAFHRVGKPDRVVNARGRPVILGKAIKSGLYRNKLTQEGMLKPVSGKRPVGFKRERTNLPTLKELAWAAKSSNENFETVKTMNNKQLKLLSKVGPINWTLMKPKPRPTANNIARQRNTAARKIQGAAKKYLRRKSAQRVRGPSPRSPATLARQANLGIMGGAQHSPNGANNTRVTWTRRANGTINRHKTIENLRMKLTNAQRNALEQMSENKAMNTIRQMARQR